MQCKFDTSTLQRYKHAFYVLGPINNSFYIVDKNIKPKYYVLLI